MAPGCCLILNVYKCLFRRPRDATAGHNRRGREHVRAPVHPERWHHCEGRACAGRGAFTAFGGGRGDGGQGEQRGTHVQPSRVSFFFLEQTL